MNNTMTIVSQCFTHSFLFLVFLFFILAFISLVNSALLGNHLTTACTFISLDKAVSSPILTITISTAATMAAI